MEEEKEPIVIFQCLSCNKIIGDSTVLIEANQDMQTVTVSGTFIEVKRRKHAFFTFSFRAGGQNLVVDMEASIRTEDDRNSVMVGSTYRDLKCKGCSTVLGRSYFTTPSSRDYVRDAYTLDCRNISSYKVGSCESIDKEEDKLDCSDRPMISLIGMDARKALMMNEQIVMVQKCIMDLAKEVQSIERVVQPSSFVENVESSLTTKKNCSFKGRRRSQKKQQQQQGVSRNLVEDDEEYIPPSSLSSSSLSSPSNLRRKNVTDQEDASSLFQHQPRIQQTKKMKKIKDVTTTKKLIVPSVTSEENVTATTTTTTTTTNQNQKKKKTFQLKPAPKKSRNKSATQNTKKKQGRKLKWTKEHLSNLQRGVNTYGPNFEKIYADPEFKLSNFSSAKVVKAAYYYHLYTGRKKKKKKDVRVVKNKNIIQSSKKTIDEENVIINMGDVPQKKKRGRPRKKPIVVVNDEDEENAFQSPKPVLKKKRVDNHFISTDDLPGGYQ